MFPGDCKFEKVKQTSDRVYLLEFSSNQKRFFYWMQDSETEKDVENATKVHKLLNGIEEPPATAAQ